MKTRRSVSVLLLLSLLVASVLTGCGGKTKPAEGTPPSQAQKVKLTLWQHDNPDFNEATQKAIDKFKEQNPNIEVDVQTFPYDVYIQKIKAAFAANTEPDILQIFGTWVPDYSSQGFLDAVPDSLMAQKDDFYPAALGAYTWQGKLYGLPHEYNLENGGMLVHPAMFQAANLSYPKTWDELVADAKKLTKRDSQGITQAGFIFTSTDNITYSLLSFILQQGGDYWNADKTGVKLSSPEATKAWNAMLDLVLVDKVEDPKLIPPTGDEDISDYFFKGQAAMAYRGPWTIANGLHQYNLKDFEYAPVPPFAGDKPYFAAESGWGETVSARSKNKEAAWKLVGYLTGDAALDWNVRSFTVPARKGVAANPKFVEATGPMMKTSLGVLDFGRWIGPLRDRDQFFDIINRHFMAAADKLETREASLKAAETEINAMLAEKSK